MRTEGKISKVAVCPECEKFMLACHIDFLEKATEKEFMEFSNEGYIIKIETGEETRNRDMGKCDCNKL